MGWLDVNDQKQLQRIAEESKRIADSQNLLANTSIRIAIALERIAIGVERLSDPTSFKVHERSLGGLTPPITSNQIEGHSIRYKIEGENFMAPMKAGVDLQIIDNGKGVLYTLTPQKAGTAIGLPPNTPPAAINVTPAALNVVPDPGDPNATPPRPADTTGLVFLGTITQPPQDVDNVVATFNYTFPDGVQLAAVAAGVDIAPSETDPDSFVISESAL